MRPIRFPLVSALLAAPLASGCVLVHVRGNLAHDLPLGELVAQAVPVEAAFHRGPLELDGNWGVGRRRWEESLELEFDCDEEALAEFFAALQLGLEARIAQFGTLTAVERPTPWLVEYEFVARDEELGGDGEAQLEIVRLEEGEHAYRVDIRWERAGGFEAAAGLGDEGAWGRWQ